MVYRPDLVRAEREALVELLETLTPAEWSTPSLCTGWTVQEVAAHLAWGPDLSLREAVPELVRSGLSGNELNARLARRWSLRGPDAVLAQLRAGLVRVDKPRGVPGEVLLVDAVLHQLDIRRPLGRQRPIGAEAFALTAAHQLEMRWPATLMVGGNIRKRVDGVRLVADDVGWSHGQGLDVHGSAESLLLLLSGRPFGPDELTGPGAAQLYGRL